MYQHQRLLQLPEKIMIKIAMTDGRRLEVKKLERQSGKKNLMDKEIDG